MSLFVEAVAADDSRTLLDVGALLLCALLMMARLGLDMELVEDDEGCSL